MRKVKGHADLVKTKSGAVVSTNMRRYQEHLAAKQKEQDLETRLDRIERLLEELINGKE